MQAFVDLAELRAARIRMWAALDPSFIVETWPRLTRGLSKTWRVGPSGVLWTSP
jgi:hypothetical protein